MNATIAAQRQVEVQGVLRQPLKDAADLQRVRALVRDCLVGRLFPSMNAASKRSGIPLDAVFQYLLHTGQEISRGAQIDFDAQHGDGFVPMHQAKVLDRSKGLGKDLQIAMAKQWTSTEVAALCGDITNLKSLFRMKVEDANDLSMATKTAALVSEYLEYIATQSGGSDKALWGLYTNSSQGGEVVNDENREPTFTAVDSAAILKGVPSVLMGLEAPVAARIDLLQGTHRWIEGHLADPRILAVVGPAVVAQLTDKRSTIVKLSCAIIRAACVQKYFSAVSCESRDVAMAWLAACLRQVHVTVGAIASEAHSAAVHIIYYAAWDMPTAVCARLAQTAKGAPQVVLRRRALEYLCMVLLKLGESPSGASEDVKSCVDACAKHANADVRKACRMVVAATDASSTLFDQYKTEGRDPLIEFAEGALNVSLQVSKRNSRLRSLRADSSLGQTI